ncbi:serine acetyltransferase [Rhodococcus sp. IEGM 1381]|uniref:serine acetyltransferase n=1 Tax=Rhodococcus sp. IEGM 1381 TaxID=3047085 RepID=UPI0024B67125|nr:serine acetyltransferase [Rhodococcus sp. IEGM 1381]MDI9894239.1 serine acetyltransferase [Rhodococcus sp. IEGM 1381]
MAYSRSKIWLLRLGYLYAYPLEIGVSRANAGAIVRADVDRWIECIGLPELNELGPYARFCYLASALREFRSLLHYRIRAAPTVIRAVLKVVYRGEPTLILEADSIGPGLFIQHGYATLVSAESIGSNCWINQNASVGYSSKGRPTLGDDVTVGPGAVVTGPIMLHDGCRIGPNAVVFRDVEPATTMLAGPTVARKSSNDQ